MGVGLFELIKNDITQNRFNIKTQLQAIVVRTALHKISINSLYIPPSEQRDKDKLQKFDKSITQTFILPRDLNSHNTI